jgi:hypothetical protein
MTLARWNENQAAASERVTSALAHKGTIARLNPEQMIKVMPVRNVPEWHLFSKALDGDS